jgi:outer membrane protein TolC
MNLRTGLLLFLLTPIIAFAQDTARKEPDIHQFSIQQCVDYAAKNNVQVKNAILSLQLQAQQNKSITAGALPTVSGSGNFTDYLQIPTTLIPGQFFGGAAGTYIPVKFGTKYSTTATVSLQQTLFDGQVFIGLQARQTALDYAAKNIEVTQEMIKANIYKIYYQLVASKTQIAQLDGNILLAQTLLHDQNEMYKNGFAEQMDADKASVQLTNIETQKLSVLNNVSNGYLSLKILMGMPVKDSLALTDEVNEAKIKEGLLNEGVYDYKDRLDYQFLDLGKKLQEYNVKRYQLSYLPTLGLVGAYSKSAQRTDFDFFGKGDWFSTSYFGINLNVPIFSGFAKNANLKTARLQLQQQQNQIDNLKLSIDKDVAQATNNFRNAVTILDNQKKNMELAQRVYDEAKKKYESGTGSTLEITSAQTDLTTAQNNYTNAMYDAIIAKVDYMNATGKL